MRIEYENCTIQLDRDQLVMGSKVAGLTLIQATHPDREESIRRDDSECDNMSGSDATAGRIPDLGSVCISSLTLSILRVRVLIALPPTTASADPGDRLRQRTYSCGCTAPAAARQAKCGADDVGVIRVVEPRASSCVKGKEK